MTATEQYIAFLEGIKKVNTGTITPARFNSIINESQTNIIMGLVGTGEIVTKPIDDLECIREITDSEVISNGITPAAVLHPIAPDTGSNYVFTLPKDDTIDINSYTSVPASKQKYPKLLRTLAIEFKIEYSSNVCGLTGISEWLGSEIMRSDKKQPSMKSKYRKPTDERLYFEFRQGKVVLLTGTSSIGKAMKIDYYRYPKKINYNATNPSLNVNSEFNSQFCQWIVDDAVRTYIERVADPRYQTFLMEEKIKSGQKIS
jgi:hypothetical protein